MNIATIICGYENADVIPYVARVPLAISKAVIFIDGVRPIIRRNEPKRMWRDYSDVPYSRDLTEEVCRSIGVDYYSPRRPLYNGEKINIGKEILRTRTKYDIFLYLESDEAIEPDDIDLLMNYLHRYIEQGQKFAFVKMPVIELWKDMTGFGGTFSSSKFVLDNTFTFPIGDEGHNVNYFIKDDEEEVSFIPVYFASSVRLYHLHHFRKNAMCRVHEGIFHDGELRVNVEDCKFPLQSTQLLKDIYKDLTIIEPNLPKDYITDTYMGRVL